MRDNAVVLLVEDNEDDVFFMERTFEKSQMRGSLHVVRSGDDAIRYLAGEDGFGDRRRYPMPNLIFLDLKMPGMDGFDVLAWLKKQQHLNMPVAVLTSSPEERDMRRVRELGGACYLLKPPSTAMLTSCFKQFGLANQ